MDAAYGSKANRAELARQGLVADIHTRKPKGKPMTERARKANLRRSKVRGFVDPPFAHIKGPMRLFVSTIGIKRARSKIGMANLAYNFRRYMFWQSKTA